MLILTATGCTRIETRTEYVKPVCEAPPLPEYPFVDAAELWLKVGPDMYESLETGLIERDSHINELRMMIRVLCQSPG